MADINTYLQRIKDAIYGEEVRGSIYDAIAAMNEESVKAMQYAATARDSAQQYSGNPARPNEITRTWWIWNATTQQYEDTHFSSEIEGPRGVGITDIRLTSGDNTPGTVNIYTVETTDGDTYNISVWNGRNGDGVGDVLGKTFDLLIPASGWNNRRITIADERLLALSTQKYFISAYEACRREYLSCEVRPNDITANGFITFTCEIVPSNDLLIDVIRFELAANG